MKNFYFILFTLIGCGHEAKSTFKAKTITIEEQIIESNCPSNMKLISGQYCPHVIQNCKSYMESPDSTPFARCLEFEQTKCIGKKVEMNFCIDTEEYSFPSDEYPLSNVSWTKAQQLCQQDDKRLCQESEWEFACEGEEMLPYTTGYKRPSKQCNMDISKNVICNGYLCDYKKPLNDNLECKSPFGVHNMSGNVDEWIIVSKYAHSKIPDLWMRSALKGGHWLPVRNRCRPKTVDHDESFYQISVGFRCCKDI